MFLRKFAVSGASLMAVALIFLGGTPAAATVPQDGSGPAAFVQVFTVCTSGPKKGVYTRGYRTGTGSHSRFVKGFLDCFNGERRVYVLRQGKGKKGARHGGWGFRHIEERAQSSRTRVATTHQGALEALKTPGVWEKAFIEGYSHSEGLDRHYFSHLYFGKDGQHWRLCIIYTDDGYIVTRKGEKEKRNYGALGVVTAFAKPDSLGEDDCAWKPSEP